VQRRRVGSSGLQVSRIGLGTMTWGDDTDPDGAAEQLRSFVGAGGTLVEIADGYGGGAAQDVLAGLLRRAVARDDLVLAGRSVLPDGPHGGGAGRAVLLRGLDRVLRRLGVEHLDLWQVPGWDGEVPLDETLATVDAAVASGRVRYVGLVGPTGWQLATTAERARARWPRALPTSVQAEYSLLARDSEVELLPAAAHHGAGLLAWAPLGRGVLTGKYAEGTPPESRGASAALGPYVEERRTERSSRIVQAVLTAAEGLGTSPLSVALAWVRDQPGVAAAVVGARDAAQLGASTAAEAVELPDAIRAALDDVSRRS
jgi:aryl-alcohol dehydrogenase-like predicted oxidoreductase